MERSDEDEYEDVDMVQVDWSPAAQRLYRRSRKDYKQLRPVATWVRVRFNGLQIPTLSAGLCLRELVGVGACARNVFAFLGAAGAVQDLHPSAASTTWPAIRTSSATFPAPFRVPLCQSPSRPQQRDAISQKRWGKESRRNRTGRQLCGQLSPISSRGS